MEEGIYLDPAIFCELDTMIRNELMDLAVLVALALRVADEDDHLHAYLLTETSDIRRPLKRTRGLPMVAADTRRSYDLFLYAAECL